jgi:PAS domain S-box-containing protein
MKKSVLPLNESERLKALESYSIMDSLPEQEYDSITQLASYICGTPIALISLLDEGRQWFKSSVGLSAIETPRDISFCQYAIMGEEVYEVNNALENETFADNPLVTGNPDIRFYAGAPLHDVNGFNLGSLCVIDTKPRILSDEQKNALKLLANQVVLLLDLRKKNIALKSTQQEFKNFLELSKDLVCIANIDGTFQKVNSAFTDVLGYSKEELEGIPFVGFIHSEDIEISDKEVEKLAQGQKTISFENRYRSKNGAYVLLSWNVTPEPETGNLYCTARDVTFERSQQEIVVQTSNELKAILNASEFSIIATDLDGMVKEFNKGAEVLLGYKADELVGKSSVAIFHSVNEVVQRSQDLSKELGEIVEPGFDVLFIKTRKSGVADTHEWTYLRKDGTTFPVQLSITAIKNSIGEITGYLGIAKDISKEKEAELNLINSNNLLDESQRIAKTGSWKYDINTNNLIWSKGHYSVFELEKLPENELNNAYRSRIHPEDLVVLDELSENIVKTGKDFKVSYRIVLPDSRIKQILEIGQPYKNRRGEVVGIQGTIQDITEKTLAEQIIIEKAKEINDVRSALDESSIVTITDQKGIINFVNDKFCSISKYSKEELLGQYHYLDNPHYKLNKFIKNMWKVIANGQVWQGEIMNVAKDGSFYWVYSTIVPFLDNEGKPYQYIAISSDITEQKQAQKNLNNALTDLEKKNKELDQFAYIVSHDLKAPLRAINNLSEWIMEDMPDMPAEVSSNFGLLRGRVMRMENLINGVLDYSRIGKVLIEKQLTDLKKMLHYIVETIVPTEGYVVYIADNIPEIKIARILFQQIFTNLISNAIKYNDKPIGKIECLYESLPGFHQFTIKDNGPGIAKEYHEKVFKVFQTIEARDKKESTGVGLSIVQKIVEEKGGTIRIESEEDKGASFIFTIPK